MGPGTLNQHRRTLSDGAVATAALTQGRRDGEAKGKSIFLSVALRHCACAFNLGAT